MGSPADSESLPPAPSAPPSGERPPPSRARGRVEARPAALGGRRTFAIVALVAVAAAAVACAWANVDLVRFLGDIPAEGYDGTDKAVVSRATAVDGAVASAARLSLLARLLCAVAFLLWFYRAHANLRAGGLRDLQHSSGWAVGSFFVPIVSLFVPFLAAQEIWRGSASLAGEGPLDRWKRSRASPLVAAWWFSFLASNVISVVANFLGRASRAPWPDEGRPSVASLMRSTTMTIGSYLLELPAAIAAIVLVVRVSRMQERWSDEKVAEIFR